MMVGRPMPGNRVVRFRFLDGQGRWVPTIHTPKEVLGWAADLKPDVFQRTFSMYPAVSLDRPIPDGYTVGSFLDEMAQVAGGYHTPRIDVKPGSLTDAQILELCDRLLGMPLTPRLRFLSIDNYPSYAKQRGPDATERLLQAILDQGWEGIELLIGGTDRRGVYLPPPPTFGKAATVGYCISTPDFSSCTDLARWDNSRTGLDWVRRQNPGAKVLMNVDFPQQIDCFKQLGPEGMATIFSKVAAEQASREFTFIWPIFSANPPPNNQVGQWDSTQYVLSNGLTLYDVERDLMLRYNPKA